MAGFCDSGESYASVGDEKYAVRGEALLVNGLVLPKRKHPDVAKQVAPVGIDQSKGTCARGSATAAVY